jgi:hypothetical protein
MRFSLSLVTLAIGLATAAPIDDPASPFTGAEPFPYGICSFRDRLSAGVVDFISWITDCGDQSGHTTGLDISWQGYNGLWAEGCRGDSLFQHYLQKTSGIDDCAVTAFECPVCDDYPFNGAYRAEPGCLWTGDREFQLLQGDLRE